MASHRVSALGHPFSELDAGRDRHRHDSHSVSVGRRMPEVISGAPQLAALSSDAAREATDQLRHFA
jgi:hypothetical protein